MRSEKSDHSLLEEFASGHEHAFDLFYQRHQAKLYSFVLSITGDETLAAEAMQSAFVQCFRNLRQFLGAANVSNYLFSTARNEAWSRRRKNAKRREIDLGEFPTLLSGAKSPGALTEESDRAKEISNSLMKLPEEEREAVHLHVYGNFSFAEMEDICGIPKQTLYSRFHRGLEKLEKLLSEKFNRGAL